MQIKYGIDNYQYNKNNKVFPVIWDSKKVINGHVLIMGKSGTGKTYTLRKMLSHLKLTSEGKKIRCHIMDVHGDIDIEGSSTVKFSESTNYGFNPLLINPDPDFGGVRKRIQYFLSALNRTSRKLGTKQESVLRNILYDLYAANGFYDGKPESWRLQDGINRRFPKKNPTLEDAYKFAQFKLKGMYLGTSSKTVSALETLNKKMNNFYNKQKMLVKAGHDKLEEDKLKEELKKLGEEAKELFGEHIDSIQTGMELNDVMKYDSKETMKSVVERLENLNAIGIFKSTPPPFDPDSMIWRYDIKALSTDEKKLFVSFVLESIFTKSVENGVQDDLVEVIVLDEAHLFLSDEEDNIINTIAKEARKFGLGMFCASQSPTHFSDDFISNVATKVILGIDQIYWDGSVRKLKIEQSMLEWIVPHQSLVVQINNKGETRNKFLSVLTNVK